MSGLDDGNIWGFAHVCTTLLLLAMQTTYIGKSGSREKKDTTRCVSELVLISKGMHVCMYDEGKEGGREGGREGVHVYVSGCEKERKEDFPLTQYHRGLRLYHFFLPPLMLGHDILPILLWLLKSNFLLPYKIKLHC